MTRIYENNAGGTPALQIPTLQLENSCLKVIVSPHIGGRIVDVKAGERQFLYTTYPEGRASGSYTEFGGIEEFLDRPPGTLCRLAWQSNIEEDGINLCFRQQDIFLEKRISLDETMPIVRIEYSFLNIGPNFAKPAFGIHPEICLDNDVAVNRYYIPVKGGMLSGGREQIKKRYVKPSQGWCAGAGTNSLIAMLFPDRLLDGVEVYYPQTGTHLSLSPLIYYLGMCPGREAKFDCEIYFGEGDADFAFELWKKRAGELTSQYISAPKDRLEMAGDFKVLEYAQVPIVEEDSEERQLLLEKTNKLEEQKEGRMEILRLLREKQIGATEAIDRLMSL